MNAPTSIYTRLARVTTRLTAPWPYAGIGFGALLVWLGGFMSITVITPHQLSLASIATFGVSAVGLLTLFFVACGGSPQGIARVLSAPARKRVETAVRVALTFMMGGLAVLSFLLIIAALQYAFEPPGQAYFNDVISFSAANAHALLAGNNPYTDDANFIPTLITYPHAPPTPMQGAIFGYGYDYPRQSYVYAIDTAYIRQPAAYAAAFDPRTLHSYPALSFLVYVPLFAVGIQNVMWLNLVAYAALLAWMIALAPRTQRGWVTFTALAALSVTFNSLLLETELICLLFLLPAWALRDRKGWLSALLLGLACAFKQYCWFFAPLFLLDSALRHGWREAGRRALITLAAFLAPNAPFIIASATAWWQSLWLPLSLAVFPQGMGLVTLALGHVIPSPPKALFTFLEVAAVGGALWLYAHYWERLREAAPLLALLPFFFAFRSPPNYFSIAPWLALFAWLWLQRAKAKTDLAAAQPIAKN
ncbi:MAG TPA: glycosyltransferase 87 family protein [Ktedonobacterales bacterium]